MCGGRARRHTPKSAFICATRIYARCHKIFSRFGRSAAQSKVGCVVEVKKKLKKPKKPRTVKSEQLYVGQHVNESIRTRNGAGTAVRDIPPRTLCGRLSQMQVRVTSWTKIDPSTLLYDSQIHPCKSEEGDRQIHWNAVVNGCEGCDHPIE